MAEAITVKELLAAHARRGASLPAETGLFIVLEAADAMCDAPGRITVADVSISSDGDVTITVRPTGGDSAAIASLVALAESVLSPLPASARATFERMRSGDIVSLSSARAGIEALLVPLNRSAARRVLGRLARETGRASGSERDALATDPGSAPASALDTAPDSVPPFPPPPRVGNLHSLPGVPSAVDTAPDGTPTVEHAEVEPHADASVPRRRARGMVPVIVAILLVAVAALGWFVYVRLP